MSPRPMQLLVEGPNDHHPLLHLLRKSDVLSKEFDENSSPLHIQSLKTKKLLIEDVSSRYKEAGKVAVGYVVDADDASGDPPGRQPTWQAICHRLRQMSIVPPAEPPADGYIVSIGDSGPRIGVWIMPDNIADGAIEEFLLSLIDPSSSLWQYAQSATTTARVDHGADFTLSNQPKAELACWLAWQKEPAMKYGEAMQAGKFDCQKDLALRFAAWVRQLFDL